MSQPPEFILNICKVILLTPEEIRLSKRNNENLILIESLNNTLKILLGLSSSSSSSTSSITSNITSSVTSSEINDSLIKIGYVRNWSSSVRERLLAITWIVLNTNILGRKLVCYLYDKIRLEYPNISILWYQSLFPIIPRTISIISPITNLDNYNNRESSIQGYGRIIHKLKLLKDLEQCRLKLMRKIIEKFNEIKLNQEKEGIKTNVNINDEDFLTVCLGLILPDVLTGSKQEGSLRMLRNEISKIEESICIVNETQVHMEKYLNWLGIPEQDNILINLNLNNSTDEIELNNELLECIDMLASIESILPNILLNGHLPILNNDEIYQVNIGYQSSIISNNNQNIHNNNEDKSTNNCIQKLCDIAENHLFQINNNYNNSEHNENEESSIEEEKKDKKEIKLITPSTLTTASTTTLLTELSSNQIIHLPFNIHDETSIDLSMSSLFGISSLLENNYEMETTLMSLRNSHSEVLQRTKNITKKYSPYEFVSLKEESTKKKLIK